MIAIWSFLRSNFNALLLVVAVVGIATVATSAYRLGKQTEAIEHLTTANKLWQDAFKYQDEARKSAETRVQEMQAERDKYRTASNERTQKIKELERNNAELKALLDTHLPDELVRLLNSK